jgi:hypothetical protein
VEIQRVYVKWVGLANDDRDPVRATGKTRSPQKTNRRLAIYNLNQNVLKAGPNTATSELIAGWYANGSTTLDKNYLPASWQGQGPASTAFYQNVIARTCRTCHVAMVEAFDFEHFPMGGMPANAPPNRIFVVRRPAARRAGQTKNRRWKSNRMPMRYGEHLLAARGGMARAAKVQAATVGRGAY